jgi:predicted SprT family Zn-dependent metalloprotease
MTPVSDVCNAVKNIAPNIFCALIIRINTKVHGHNCTDQLRIVIKHETTCHVAVLRSTKDRFSKKKKKG